ncbi:MAG TPA: transglutaminase domain-containing protein [Archangium sp.]|nr:transglutaminase domain-containing protein [Archangium sp.]
MQFSTDFKRRRTSLFMQAVSVLVTAFFFSYFSLRPLAAAAQPGTGRVPLPSFTWTAPRFGPPAEEVYAQGLERLREVVKQSRSHKRPEHVKAIREQLEALEKLDSDVDESFAEVIRHLEDKYLAQELMDRHLAAEESFRQKRAELKKLARALENAKDEAGRSARIKELDAFLSSQPGMRHKKLDPKRLPWRVHKPTPLPPALTPESFTLVRSEADVQGGTAQGEASAPSASTPASTPELAETDDVQLTPAIRALAASLGNDPVRIYHWVRNNLTFVPSFGSIQGSDVTLSKRRGNAFDIASLLIALYRANGIPARYVYGTIEVPAAAAMNWVGGVSTPEAAHQLLAQGGVPTGLLASGGRITHLQLEHVWAEVWVDFVPSRGAKHRQGDTWVPMDASFKQYTYPPALAASVNVPVDGAALRTAALDGALVNEAEGWVQGLQGEAVKAATVQYFQDFNAAITQAAPSATNAEVFGPQPIQTFERDVLDISLPYRTVAIASRYTDLPGSLTHKFRYQVYASDMDRAFGGPMLSFEDSLPRLAGRKVTLFYAPATQADADLIVSYLPKPLPDGTMPTPEQYAAVRLPAYLIHLRPELRVDGVVRAVGETLTMGTELPAVGAFTNMDLKSGWDETSDRLTAGQATSIGLNLQGIDVAQLTRLQSRLAETKARIDARDTTHLTGDLVSGDVLAATIWSYFAAVDRAGRTTAWRSGIVDLPALSFGLVHVDVDITYSWGVARSARPSGILLDVGHLRSIRWSKTNDATAWRTYNRVIGQHASAMEHHIPESLFVGPQTPGEAVSAVKLLGKAAAEGQRIYTITQANIGTALSQLSLSAETLNEISSSVAAGKEVTVHQRPVTVNGWSGAGYIVLDPATGAGGYLIEGGANGGKLLAALSGLLWGGIAGIYLGALIGAFLAGGATLGAFIVVALMIALIFLALNSLVKMFADDDTYACYAGGASAGFGLAMIFVDLTKTVQVIATIFGWVTVAGNAVRQCF